MTGKVKFICGMCNCFYKQFFQQLKVFFFQNLFKFSTPGNKDMSDEEKLKEFNELADKVNVIRNLHFRMKEFEIIQNQVEKYI